MTVHLILLVMWGLSVLALLIKLFFYVSSINKRIIENNKLRDEKLDESFNQVKAIAENAVEIEKRAIKHDGLLDKKINELSRFVDKQQQDFIALAKSDMLSARHDELMRTQQLKSALERIMGMAMSSRQEPAIIDVLALESVNNRIKELEEILRSKETPS